MKRILFSAAPADGGGTVPQTTPNPTAPTDPTNPAGGAPVNTAPPAAPPAAAAVLNGEHSERMAQLEEQLTAANARMVKTEEEKKQREVKIAELEDQLSQLRAAPPSPAAGAGTEDGFCWPQYDFED